MKKRIALSAACVLVLLLIAAGTWYTRPVTFSQLLPELDQSKANGITATYTISETGTDGRTGTFSHSINLNDDNSAIQWLFLILNAQTYHRSFTNLLPHFGSATTYKNSPWTVVMHGGYSLQFYAGTNKLDIRYVHDEGECYFTCTVENHEEFIQAVTELLVAKTPKE